MGLLDIFGIIGKEGKQYLKDAMPGGLLNRELDYQGLRKAGEVASMTPTPIGDLASGLLAVDDLRNRQYGSAALNSIGLLPFVPGMAGMMKNVKFLPDWADELTATGGKLNPDGTLTVFHRTSKSAADAIKKTGKMTGKENALYFATRPDGQVTGYGDDFVQLNIPANKLELDDIFDNEAHFTLSIGKPGNFIDVSKWLKK